MQPPTSPARVAVLMSTYNGERFVAEQLRSILEQLPEQGRLLVRDDGSSDHTLDRINDVGDPRVSVSRGTNLGFAHSFLTLLQEVPDDAAMVMFADQDDVWLTDKIERAWKHLAEFQTEPALYCSAQMLVDEKLQPLNRTPDWPRKPSFAGALSENIVTGCTAALNPSAVKLLQRAGVPDRVRFHDWWLYIVVSAFGVVVFDSQPTVLYRQHGGNQIGHGAGWWGRQLQIARFLLRHDWVGILLGQVAEFHARYFVDLDSDRRRLLETYFIRKNGTALPSVRLIFNLRRWRQRLTGELTFRAMIAAYLLRLWPPAKKRLRN